MKKVVLVVLPYYARRRRVQNEMIDFVTSNWTTV
jgi:hypothetical protein